MRPYTHARTNSAGTVSNSASMTGRTPKSAGQVNKSPSVLPLQMTSSMAHRVLHSVERENHALVRPEKATFLINVYLVSS